MKTKLKIWIGVCTIVLCLGIMALGVYSALSASININGMLGFNMHNAIVEVYGTISPVAEIDDTTGMFVPTTKEIKRAAMGGEEQTVSNLNVGDLYFYNQEDMVFDMSFKNLGSMPITITIAVDLKDNSNNVSIIENTEYISFTNNTYENFILADDTKQVKFALKLNGTSIELGKNAFSINVSFAEVQGVGLTDIVDNIGVYEGIKYTLDNTTPIATTTSSKPSFLSGSATPLSAKTIYTASVTGYDSTAIVNYPDVKIQPFVTNGTNLYMVTSLGKKAFYNCTSLTSVIIPDSVTTIYDSSFGSFEGAFCGCTNLVSVKLGVGLTSIGQYAFAGCSKITSVTIPGSVTNIGQYALYGCTSLTSVTIPGSVTNMGQYAFWSCTGLTSVTISNGVTSIGDYVFSSCTGLTSVTIPESITSISFYAFDGCEDLTRVNISSLETWCDINFKRGFSLFFHSRRGDIYLNDVKITDLKIPDGVTELSDGVFRFCTGLTSVTIPNSVMSIGSYAFYNCTSLTNITIPNGVMSIGANAFKGCTGLTEATISNGVTSIGDYVFSGCTSLSSVTIGNNVTTLGSYAFENCTGLADITIPNSVNNIGSYTFAGCSALSSVTIGSGVTSIGENAFNNCSALTKVNILSVESWCNITFGNSISNPLYYGKNLYLNNVKITSLVIPNSITTLNFYAFYECRSITSVIIPSSVTVINYGAFAGCASLKTVTFESSTPPGFGTSVFNGCSALANIYVPTQDAVTAYQAVTNLANWQTLIAKKA